MLSLLTGTFFICSSVCVVTNDSSNVPVTFSPVYQNSSVIARIGNDSITADEFYYGYEYGPAFVKRNPESKKTYLKYLIDEKILAQDGYSRKLDTTSGFHSYYDEIEADLVTEELYKKEIVTQVKINQGEIDSLAKTKKITVSLRWIFSQDKNWIAVQSENLKTHPLLFDSLFNLQLNEKVTSDLRSMETTWFQLKKKNSALASLIENIKVNSVSPAVKQEDGFYIFKLDKIETSPIITEAEWTDLQNESKSFLVKQKSDQLSDAYVQEILIGENPVIKRNVFNILKSYLGLYELDKKTYSDWELDQLQKSSLEKVGNPSKEKIADLVLVTSKSNDYSLNDFISWYRIRSQYIKIDKKDKQQFSRDIESYIWQMLRDRNLTRIAYQKNYQSSEWVKKQSSWWKDKIIYSIVRDELLGSVNVKNDDDKKPGSSSETKANELILRKIQQQKLTLEIDADEKALEQIPVSDENERHAIEIYFVHKGGLIPRTPFPSIDHQWAAWE